MLIRAPEPACCFKVARAYLQTRLVSQTAITASMVASVPAEDKMGWTRCKISISNERFCSSQPQLDLSSTN